MDQTSNKNQSQVEIPCECKYDVESSYLNIESSREDDLFYCYNCALMDNNMPKYLLINILQNEKKQFLLNWPHLDDKELVQQIREFSFQQNSKQQVMLQIENFFKDFITEFTEVLGQKQKIILNNQNLINEDIQKLLDFYKETAQLEDINKIIQNQSSSKQQKANQILQIINNKKNDSKDNTNKIRLMIDKINQQPKVNLETLNQYKQSIISQIQLIDNKHFADLKAISEKNFLNAQSIQKIKSENNTELIKNGNLDIILQLISNKTNFCTQKYTDSLQFELLKLQEVINALNIEKDVYVNGKKQINFNNFNANQIEDIEILCLKIEELNSQLKQQQEQGQKGENSDLFKQLQPSSDLIANNIDKVYDCIDKQKKEKIKQLLRKYPIFEIEQIIKVIPYKFKIDISNWQDFNLSGRLTQDNNGNQKLETVQQKHFISYIEIKQNSLYKMVIELKLLNKHLFIGLVGKSHKDSQYIHESSQINSFIVGSNYGDRGVSKVVKGKCLRDVNYPNEYNQIEITFCVKNKLFQVSDYPLRQNINGINDHRLNLINLNEQYYLGFELYSEGDSLTILKFDEIQIQD
ncbi:hypothetical protein TTHERM_01064950 (macronuclear) [Tetrahymena thermophila SB210]|uniref:Zinc carboxypeptidase family protein n=1 Tax=Tetrahymena thermophila (strain SB210) TaxID=312017 RepID=Q22KU9_TETTS|nr:hypothetical protein TTHERM_01064950 [Tetrahymena thermophila SB210]EAR85929.3 hypothetical protein TTHERM_01064950 [Tetrahymena thermophila SB210]|eukprot:XP_976524.3 hypothetical protein TTHERM_01064950 [Tetrahymena thermophila SB210]